MSLHGIRRRRGQALVVAIMALTVLTAAAIALSATARLELRSARRGVDAVQRDALLRSAVNRGLALLEQGRTDPERLRSTLRQQGELHWTNLTVSAEPDAPSFQVAVQVLDASARRDLRSLDADQLEKLGVGKDAARSLLSWQEEKSRDDYGTGPRPYEPKRRPFDTVEELLQVRDVDAPSFFGSVLVQPGRKEIPLSELLTPFSGENNADAGGHPRVDVNKAGTQELMEAANRNGRIVNQTQMLSIISNREVKATQPGSGPAYRSVADALRQSGVAQHHWGPLLDAWTVDARTFLSGKVNVNTASPLVLRSLPGIGEETVNAILKQRREKPAGLEWSDVCNLAGDQQTPTSGQSGGTSNPPPDDTTALQNSVDGSQRPSLDQLEKLFCVRSSVYLIRCLVREPGSSRIDAVQAVAYWPADPDEPAKIVQWRQPDRYPGWSTWYRPVGEEEGANRDR